MSPPGLGQVTVSPSASKIAQGTNPKEKLLAQPLEAGLGNSRRRPVPTLPGWLARLQQGALHESCPQGAIGHRGIAECMGVPASVRYCSARLYLKHGGGLVLALPPPGGGDNPNMIPT